MKRADLTVFNSEMKDYTVLVNDVLKDKILPQVHHIDQFYLEDPNVFFDLIWHYMKRTQILTPPTWFGGGKLYTVREVAMRMIEKGYTFEALSKGDIPGTYALDWFSHCQGIYRSLKMETFGPMLLLRPNHHELKDCPYSSFKIIDGMHRALVLGYMLLKGEIEYAPIKAYLLVLKLSG